MRQTSVFIGKRSVKFVVIYPHHPAGVKIILPHQISVLLIRIFVLINPIIRR